MTEKLVKMCLDELPKVIVDYNLSKVKNKKKNIDTGNWKKIYKGKN